MRADGVTDVERPWMELVEARGVIAARDELLEQGIPTAYAAAISIWLADQVEGVRVVPARTAIAYRNELRELNESGYDPRRAIPG